MAIELYWGSGSPFAWRVMLTLEVKGLAYESKLLEFSKGENKAPAYLLLNPRGKVPTLKDGDFVLYESLAIMSYLDRKYPDPPLFGKTPEETGLIWRALAECESYVVSAGDKVVRPIFFGKGLEKVEEIQQAAQTLRHVPAVGSQAALHTHLVVRDDALALYGFATEEERELFLMLLSVQSVGPKVALAVLSGGPPRELLALLAAGDTGRLQAVPGIGKRTAERIVVELRERVGASLPDSVVGVTRTDDPRSLAREGLVGLGYSAAEADELLDGVDGGSPEDLIASALRSARR